MILKSKDIKAMLVSAGFKAPIVWKTRGRRFAVRCWRRQETWSRVEIALRANGLAPRLVDFEERPTRDPWGFQLRASFSLKRLPERSLR